MRQLAVLLLFALPLTALSARKPDALPDVAHPVYMKVWDGRLFVAEKSSVRVFSLGDLSQLAHFGKEGEGPGEFKLGHGATAIVMDVNSSHIVVNSAVRVALFDHQGVFERQINVGPMMHMLPFGTGFVSQVMIKGNGDAASQWIALFDSQGKRLRTLFNTDVPMGMGVGMQVPPHFYGYRVAGGRVYVATGRSQPEVTVFDAQGESVAQIKLEGFPIKLPAEYKRKVEDFYQRDVRYKNYWEYLKKFMIFPDSFPPLRDMLIDGEQIYLLTYGEKQGKYPWISINMDGKERRDLSLVGTEMSVLELVPYDIHKGIYYTLVADEEGIWHLLAERVD